MLNKLRKSTRASVMFLRKSTNFSKQQKNSTLFNNNLNNQSPSNNNIMYEAEGPKRLKFSERKLYNEKGIMSFDIRFNFREERLEKYFRENLENQDQIDFIKLIDYVNGNKVNFLEKINFEQIKFLNEFKNDFIGNYRLSAAVNIKSLEKRAELLVESRVKPINSTLKRIFRVLANFKKQAETKREKKISTEKESKIKNKKSMLQTFNLTKKLSHLGDDLAKNLSYHDNYEVNNTEKFKENNSQDSQVIDERSEFYLKTFDSESIRNGKNISHRDEGNGDSNDHDLNDNINNREKKNISFGKEENNNLQMNPSKLKGRKTIGYGGGKGEVDEVEFDKDKRDPRRDTKNRWLGDDQSAANENRNNYAIDKEMPEESANFDETKAKEYHMKLRKLLAKNKSKNRSGKVKENDNSQKNVKDATNKEAGARGDYMHHMDNDNNNNNSKFGVSNNFDQKNINNNKKGFLMDEIVQEGKAQTSNLTKNNNGNNNNNNLITNQNINEIRNLPKDIDITALRNFIREDLNRKNNINK